MTRERFRKDRPWNEYPIGTKVYAIMGGHWTRVQLGWKWFCGDTFPTPGANACGRCIELPIEIEEWTPTKRAYCCTVIGQEGLGKSIVFAESSGKARYGVAVSAAGAGYLPKANPLAIRCIRAPEYDSG